MPEFDALITAAYRAVLGREPDAEGRRHALHALEHGMPLDTYLSNLLESEEYRRRPVGGGLRFKTSKPVCTLIGGRLPLWIDLCDEYVSLPCLRDSYEPSETRFVLDRLGPGDVFLDIGANVGWFAIQAAERVGPSGRVHAFEPRAATCGLLERSVRDNGYSDRCVVHRAALGEQTARSRLLGAAGSTNLGGFRLARDAAETFDGMISEDVAVIALDDLDIAGPVRLIKMDVEGAEPSVLRGARRLLARDRPVILTEVHGPNLRHVSDVTASGFAALAAGLGYRLHALEHGRPGAPVADTEGLGDPDPVNVVMLPD